MRLKSTCRLCGSVHEALEIATPKFIGGHVVMRAAIGCFLPSGFVCQSCIVSNNIDVERAVRDYHEKPLNGRESDE